MSKKKFINSLSTDYLRSFNISKNMTDDEIFLIWKKIIEFEHSNEIEKKVKQRSFEVIKWILKMRRYRRKAHKKFIKLLNAVWYFTN